MHAAIFLAVVMGIPLPAPEARSKAAKLVQEVYGARIEQARTPLQQAQLAAEIFRVAQKEKEPAPKHAAFRQAASLAVEAGDGALALQIAEVFVEAFEAPDKRSKEQLLADADRVWEEADRGPADKRLGVQLAAAELWIRGRSASALMTEKWESRIQEIAASSRQLVLADRKAAEADVARLLGSWNVVADNEPTVWSFGADGTVHPRGRKVIGHWSIEPSRVYVQWRGPAWDSFSRPLQDEVVTGDSWRGLNTIRASKLSSVR